jgi:hypothetical protein
MDNLIAAATEARNWTQPIAEEGDTYFLELDGRLEQGMTWRNRAVLVPALEEVLGWALDQADDRSQEDEEGDTEYDALVIALRSALGTGEER